uniref:NADH-ubiquinone oxidoreductase chain 5 n=1 Tax=Pandorites podoceroides TaxID=1842081 RepID=A0A9N6YJL2_9CRUS|nr:TPA_asm: ND5 [Pandorites podoceroides]
MFMVEKKMYSIFSTGLILFSLINFSLAVMSTFLQKMIIVEWEIWGIMGSSINMSMLFDWMSLLFLSVVSVISGSVMKYSEHYMNMEKNYLRFIFILMTFVLSMLFLIISPNLISLLLGWDGLGLSSYALVIFYQSESSNNAGMITILSNRVGDVAILLSVGLMLKEGDWGFYWMFKENWESVVFLLILASITKSAQMPFSAWLPAAMAAPTPVSALVHSSTLVTAGVYLLIRFSEVVMNSSKLSWMLLMLSSMTMIMAGLGALYESDLKKVIALSTLSQLGVMIMILSLNMKELAFFHLITHALFKSTLFMCGGSMIHSVSGSQDSRMMSAFHVSSPLLGVAFSVTNMALCGFPFLAGYYSKDSLLEYMFMSSECWWVFFMAGLGTGLTVAYSLRIGYISSMNISVSQSVSGASDLTKIEIVSLMFLFMASILGGFLLIWVLMPSLKPSVLSEIEKWMVVMVSGMGGMKMFGMVQKNMLKQNLKVKKGFLFFSSMWFLPMMSTKFMMNFFMSAGYMSLKTMDKGWLELYGGMGGKMMLLKTSGILQKSQFSSSLVSSYLISSILGILLIFSQI